MLADQFLAEGREEFSFALGHPAWRELSDTLKGAQKFSIDTALAKVLNDMPRDEVRRALPFCRLPFPVVWLEVAQCDREAFTRRPVVDPGLSQPIRVGVLCQQVADDPCEFYVSLIWSFSPKDAEKQPFSKTPVNLSMGALYVRTDTPFHYEANDQYPATDEAFTATPVACGYYSELIAKLEKGAPAVLALMSEAIKNDWQGEIWYWLSALAMLNAKNGATSIPRPVQPALNRSRIKSGKSPLMDFHELTIRLHPGEKTHDRARGERGGIHAHVVRGHFKVRKTGIYWWRPFLRGDLREGFTAKQYRVKP